LSLRYVGLALFAEGATDHRFLDVLIRRVVAGLCVRHRTPTELSDVQRLEPPRGVDRAERIAQGAQAVQGAFHILFVHTDAGGDRQRACDERVEPGRRLLHERLGASQREVVGVVPVRELEAWALADPDALRRVLSSTKADDELGLPPRPRLLEHVPDPKALLADVVAQARSGRRGRRRRSASVFLDRLAEEVELDRLRELPSFAGFEAKTERALRNLIPLPAAEP